MINRVAIRRKIASSVRSRGDACAHTISLNSTDECRVPGWLREVACGGWTRRGVFPRRLNVASDRRNDGQGRAPRFPHSDSMSECRREHHYKDVAAGPRMKQGSAASGAGWVG
jgi:hypothetical protein